MSQHFTRIRLQLPPRFAALRVRLSLRSGTRHGSRRDAESGTCAADEEGTGGVACWCVCVSGRDAWEKEYKAREKSGLTQLDLAERMNTKRSNVSRMENGQNVTFATFAKYLYGCGFDFRITVFPSREAKPTGDAFRMTRAPHGRRQPAFA